MFWRVDTRPNRAGIPIQGQKNMNGRSLADYRVALFSEIEPLTIEEFAPRLISGVDGVLKALDEGADGETVAGHAATNTRLSPVQGRARAHGTAAEAGKRAERSINGAREKLNRRSELLKALVTKHKATYCQKHP